MSMMLPTCPVPMGHIWSQGTSGEEGRVLNQPCCSPCPSHGDPGPDPPLWGLDDLYGPLALAFWDSRDWGCVGIISEPVGRMRDQFLGDNNSVSLSLLGPHYPGLPS